MWTRPTDCQENARQLQRRSHKVGGQMVQPIEAGYYWVHLGLMPLLMEWDGATWWRCGRREPVPADELRVVSDRILPPHSSVRT